MKAPTRTHALRLLVAWAVLSVIGIVIALLVHLPPGDQSRQAGDETSLLQLMLILSVPVFIGVCLFILYSALVFKQERAGLVDGPPSYGNFRIQVAWVAVTAVVVFFLAGVGIAGLNDSAQATNFTKLATAGTAPVGARWPGLILGTATRDIRTDRILDEVRATGGDGRRVCDLFGLSVKAAHRHSGSTWAGQRAAVTCDRDGT